MSALASKGRDRAVAKELRRLSAASATRFAALRHAIDGNAGRPGRRLVSAQLVTLTAALNDLQLAKPTLEATLAAYGSTLGLGDGLMAECFCCTRSWTRSRAPGAVVRLVTTKPDALLLSLLCWECADRPLAEVEKRVGEAVRRDFFGGETEMLPVSALMSKGGRA